MRAVRHTPSGPAVIEVDAPDGPGERVAIVSSGICSADLHGISYAPQPVTLGHEFGGRTDDGREFAVVPNRPCGLCDQCIAGRNELCVSLRDTILGFFRDGGMADEVVVDPSCLVPLPADVDARDACLVEPLAVALHAFNRAETRSWPKTGGPVLVVGGGAIGLASVAVARHLGYDVDVVARHPFQTEAAERLGAGTARGSEYELVIEAAGTQTALDTAIERARPGGAVAIPAMYPAGVTVGIELSMREVTLVPAFTYGHHHGRREFDDAVAVLAGQPELPATMITHRFPLDDAPEAFRVAGDRAAGAIKVVLEPER